MGIGRFLTRDETDERLSQSGWCVTHAHARHWHIGHAPITLFKREGGRVTLRTDHGETLITNATVIDEGQSLAFYGADPESVLWLRLSNPFYRPDPPDPIDLAAAVRVANAHATALASALAAAYNAVNIGPQHATVVIAVTGEPYVDMPGGVRFGVMQPV